MKKLGELKGNLKIELGKQVRTKEEQITNKKS